MRIPNLVDMLGKPHDDARVTALIESALKRVYSEAQDTDLIERIIEWLCEEISFEQVSCKVIDLKNKKPAGNS